MKRIASLLMMLGLCLMVMGQVKMTPQAQMKIERMKAKARVKAPNGHKAKSPVADGQVRLVVKIADGNASETFAQMKAAGATVCGKVGQQAVIDIPIDNLDTLQGIEGIVRIDKGHKGERKTDVTRQETGVGLLNGPSLPAEATAYTGKGVTLCLIDGGFDFQHAAFKDANGQSRIKCVYMMGDNGGNKFTVDDPDAGTYTFPGSVYDTPELLATLTTDDPSEYHGTHTAGIAAGSISPQGFGGMAPEADIVLIPLADVAVEGIDEADEDAYMELALAFVDAYARQCGQPVVLSSSTNSHSGPHDGTSSVCQAIGSLTDNLVPVFSAGNEGGYPVHIHRKFTATSPSFKTLLIGLMEDDTNTYQYISWASVAGFTRVGGEEVSIQLRLMSINQFTGKLTAVWSSDTFTATPGCEPTYQIASSDDDATLGNYFDGDVAVGAFDYGDGRLAIAAELEGGMQKLYLFQLIVSGADGTEIDMWDSVAGFGGSHYLGLPGHVDGDSEMSAGDWTCTDRVISVGAYCSNVMERTYDGEVTDTSTGTGDDEAYVMDDIAWFSSYGTSFNDVSQPVVCAPGVNVVSSINHYSIVEAADAMQWQGYPYSAESGTSMSCPAVAGIVALWLQANPTLTFDDVIDVISHSSRTDEFTESAPERWGAGKIDAVAGINYILDTTTDIKEIDHAQTEAAPHTYDLQGRRVSSQPKRGIYIQQGKKIIVK